jgi:hypothetical protein
MSWIFSAQTADLAPDQEGADIPLGMQIVKSMVDESTSVVLVTMVTTKEDAKENAHAGFVDEYLSLARGLFTEQVTRILNYEDGFRLFRPGSDAIFIGRNLREAVETINYLLEE